MAEITIGIETEGQNNWSYEVTVKDDEGTQHAYTVTLSWQDYDLWSRGRVSPSRVVDAVFRFLLEREPASAIMTRFDCSLVRRYFPEVDQTLPTMF